MPPLPRILPFLLTFSTLAAFCTPGGAAAVDFSRDIQPLIAERCHECHGDKKQKGGLRLDNKLDAFAAGDSGEKAIVPGHATQSLLLKLVASADKEERMPPKGEPLTEAQIAAIKAWIDAGAEWPEAVANAAAAGRRELVVTEEDRRHWALLPLRDAQPPPVANTAWPKTAVDRFILAGLEEMNLTPAAPVDRRKLARRIHFDLIGLPPKPEEIDAFIDDPAPDAYEQLIERLLASPHYGERWGRHWLDVARYADSNGQEGDQDRPTAYHYRDFVIRALNDDMPYDQFVRWQLAGAEFAPDDPQAIAATGFIVAGPHTVLGVPMEEEKIRNRFNELDDMIGTTGSAFLGLTVACARCHDHKYDPIPTRDYYQMLSAFNSGDRAEVPLVSREERRRHEAAEREWKALHEPVKKRLDDWLAEAKKPFTNVLRERKIEALKIDEEEKALLKSEPESKRGKELVRKHDKALKLADEDYRSAFSTEQRAEWDALAKELAEIEGRKPAPLPTALAMADFSAKPRETWLFERGDFSVKKEPVELGFLSVLSRERSARDYLATASAGGLLENSTYQRRAMAEWMTDLDHGAGALLARVMVNRLWQRHFGEGLVRTVNDFGVQGEAPSHPELLEWLASEFVRGGWKLKPLHRLILQSAAYLQDATFDLEKSKIDPDNRLLWRRRPLRLEAEILRDSVLAVSGQLNPQVFGPAFKAPIQAEAIQARNLKDPYPKDLKDTADTRRRTIYMFHKRVVQYPLMQAFDGPDAAASCGRRIHTTVAPQALALLNDRTIRQRAVDFAQRLMGESSDTAEDRVQRGWELALGRTPSPSELEKSARFIEAQTQQRSQRDKTSPADAQREALADFCQALFNLNEFLYVD